MTRPQRLYVVDLCDAPLERRVRMAAAFYQRVLPWALTFASVAGATCVVAQVVKWIVR